MEFYDVVQKRHSVRHFRPDPVSREVVERIIAAASAAPSSLNEQPWEFYCCRGASRSRIGQIVSQATVHLVEYMDVLGPAHYADAVEWYSSLGDAPAIIAISCLTPDSEFTAMNRYLSIGAALENMLLASVAEGLAGCCVTFTHWVKGELAAALDVPGDRSVVALVAIGYPGETPVVAPERRSDVAVWFD